MRLIDRTGDRYERLVVIERVDNRSKRDTNARWFCRCDCGRGVVAYGQDLERGKVKSCGCLNADRIMQHGFAGAHVYNVWQQMRQRCENPNAQRYDLYGGRGIRVSERWRRFENFIADMGQRPAGYSLDRIDVHGDYCKENCRWATTKQQANNKQRNRIVEHNGEKATLAEWADKTGLGWYTLRARLDLGWPIDRVLESSLETAAVYVFDGQSKTLSEWATELGIKRDTLRSRLTKLGWSVEQTLSTPAGSYRPKTYRKRKRDN